MYLPHLFHSSFSLLTHCFKNDLPPDYYSLLYVLPEICASNISSKLCALTYLQNCVALCFFIDICVI